MFVGFTSIHFKDNVNYKCELEQLFGVPKPKKIYDENGNSVAERRGEEIQLEQFMGKKRIVSDHEKTTMLDFTGKSTTVMYPKVLSVHSDHPKYIHPK